ncbi:Gfo/Idh/MocA family protein [Evansella tamaricis]|uniref:Gfo/Idh/MocA family oxidoreductase n=1 Tax=Evansella tamaricis TaxID=2069301 RepID=A0ABS6J9T4_9BACI|nr:Gfo/Idh/MocA family oxidoreductase [Evansella tamaricis]MBU9710447.1 Gfo/Idh/MocA family oxidoreductase [Evansella tamaricis]
MIRFGVIGTNWITERFIESANLVEDFQLEAVYSRTEPKAKEFASKFGITNTVTSIEKMVTGDVVDAVYIASPNSYHMEQAIQCMTNGKHVICEKPLASNVFEVNKMIQTARANNVLLMEALKTTCLPNFQVIKDNMHKIGKVRRYNANYCQYSSRYDKYKEGIVLNAFDPTFSNGSLMDIGIYCVYPLVTLFGEPNSVSAAGIKLESGVDGQGSILLSYECGMDATIIFSKIANSNLPSEIQGENGNIVIDKIHTPEHVEIHYKDGTVEDITVPQRNESMYYEVKEFIDLIKNNVLESTINTYERTFTTAKLLEESRKQMGIVYPADEKARMEKDK